MHILPALGDYLVGDDRGQPNVFGNYRRLGRMGLALVFLRRSFAAEPQRRGCGHPLSGIHKDRTPTHGYEPTREAMAAFAKSWRRE